VVTGQEIMTVPAHNGSIYSVVFSPDGRRLASASGDGKVKVWDVSGAALSGPARAIPRTAQEMDALWTSLSGDDAVKAYRSLGALVAVPDQSIPLLRKRVRSVPRLSPGDVKQVTRWLRELDDDAFDVREKADKELAKLGEAALPNLRRSVADSLSPEVRRRCQYLIDALDERSLSLEHVVALRAVDVLEQVGSFEARSALNALAAGLPDARLTREAQASLNRLARRPATP
jgi:hypothetical protein